MKNHLALLSIGIPDQLQQPPLQKDESAQNVTKADAMEDKVMAEIITIAQELEDGLAPL